MTNFSKFLESELQADAFIEDAVMSTSISSVTDAPGRREVPASDLDKRKDKIVDILK